MAVGQDPKQIHVHRQYIRLLYDGVGDAGRQFKIEADQANPIGSRAGRLIAEIKTELGLDRPLIEQDTFDNRQS